MIHGCARVSMDGQSLTARKDQLAAAGTRKIFSGTADGASRGQSHLKRLAAALREGMLQR